MPTIKSADGRCVLDHTTHRYTIDGKPALGVTEVLQDNGLIPDYFCGDEYKVRGQHVHAACHFLDEGDLDWNTLHPSLVPYVKAWESFKSEHRVTVLSCEELVYSAVYGVCGMLDRHLFLGLAKAKAILDIKTANKPGAKPPFQTRYQTAAYAGLKGIDGSVLRAAVTLWPDGRYSQLEVYNSPSDWTDFLALTQATRIRRRHGKNGLERKQDDD